MQKAAIGLTKIGDAFDADRMVKIESAHISGLPPDYDETRIERLEEEINNGLRFKCPASYNGVGFDNAPEIPLHSTVTEALGSEKYRSRRIRSLEVCRKMGADPTCTCAPYITRHPSFGKSIAWTESGAFITANSYYGSRCNREGIRSSYWAALLGRTPRYGLHLDEFRSATILFELETELGTWSDYGALGYFVGLKANQTWDVPAIVGCKELSQGQLNSFAGGLSTSGATAMFHMVGITPEAPNINAAFHNEKPTNKITVTSKEIDYVYDRLSTADKEDVQMVFIGCPHATLEQLKYVAGLLQGKKVDPSVRVWIDCPPTIRTEAQRLGYSEAIEKSGAFLLCGSCLVPESIDPSDYDEFRWKEGIHVVATDSAKMSHYSHLVRKWGIKFGCTKKCIDAAISGRWHD